MLCVIRDTPDRCLGLFLDRKLRLGGTVPMGIDKSAFRFKDLGHIFDTIGRMCMILAVFQGLIEEVLLNIVQELLYMLDNAILFSRLARSIRTGSSR